jgi:hypothetical protein
LALAGKEDDDAGLGWAVAAATTVRVAAESAAALASTDAFATGALSAVG